MDERKATALVLSGGGARGAYSVGIVAGIVEVLGLGRYGPGPFTSFTGTSVGAINTAWLAAYSDRGDMGVSGLARQWTRLKLGKHVKIDPLSLLNMPRVFNWKKWLGAAAIDPGELPSHFGRAILDPRELEKIVQDNIPWDRFHDNIRRGIVKHFIVSALRVTGGVSTIFAEVAPGEEIAASKDARRMTRVERVTADHVLASAAIPLLFPARRIGRSYYYDGGLRSNTPIAPALRAGAEKLVVVSLLHPKSRAEALLKEDEADAEQYPNTLFLLGKVLDALLLDPVDYDLQVLDRLNKLIDSLEHTLTPYAFANIMRMLAGERGTKYRRVQTLVFRPSEDIGILAGEYFRHQPIRFEGPDKVATWMLSRAAAFGRNVEADLGSFLLFDGGFSRLLIELGKRDALKRADDILAFFRTDTLRPKKP